MNYIIAINYQEAEYWIREMNLNFSNRTVILTDDMNAAWATKGRKLKPEDSVIYVGRYYDGKYYLQVMDAIKMMEVTSGLTLQRVQ